MKKTIIVLCLSLLIQTPAQAVHFKKVAYKAYHFGVYWPVKVITVAIGVPALVIGGLNFWADAELEYDPIANEENK